jgi:hypothetical protein
MYKGIKRLKPLAKCTMNTTHAKNNPELVFAPYLHQNFGAPMPRLPLRWAIQRCEQALHLITLRWNFLQLRAVALHHDDDTLIHNFVTRIQLPTA